MLSHEIATAARIASASINISHSNPTEFTTRGPRGNQRPASLGHAFANEHPSHSSRGCKRRAAEKEMNVKDKIDRRSFLKVAGMSVGIGVVYQFAPMLVRHAQAGTVTDFFKQ